MKKQLFRLTEEMILFWKECVIDYLTNLYEKPIGELAAALLAPGALTPRPRLKGYILLEPGALAFEAHYLKKGLAKLYSIDKKTGFQKIFYFWDAGSIIVMYEEFRENLPSGEYYIELVEDCELVTITNFCMDGIYQQHPVAHELTHKITSEQKRFMLQHMDILLTPTKGDRLAMFEERFSKLRGRLSNEEICGFLGIRPTTLGESKA